jgi:hypothetical protein
MNEIKLFPVVNKDELEALKSDLVKCFQGYMVLWNGKQFMKLEEFHQVVLQIEEVLAVAKNIESAASERAF